MSEIPVSIESGTARRESSVRISVYSRKRALRTGLNWGAACWLMAIICIPIPIVHFVAVPGCLLMGPPLAFMMFKMHLGARDIDEAQLPCPACGKDFTFRKRPERWPQDVPCPACAAPLVVEPLRAYT